MLEWIKRKIGIQETNEETEEKQDIDTAVAEEAEEAQDEAAENVQEAADSVEEAADNEAADLIKHKAYDFSNAADEEAGNVEPAEESDEAPTEGMPEEEPEEEEPIEETILPEEEYDVVAAETDSTAEPETDAEEDRMEASEASPKTVWMRIKQKMSLPQNLKPPRRKFQNLRMRNPRKRHLKRLRKKSAGLRG